MEGKMKFTFAKLNEKAEGHKNYRDYVNIYFCKLRDKEPDEKIERHFVIIGELFGLHYKSVERIIKRKNGKIELKKRNNIWNKKNSLLDRLSMIEPKLK